MFLLKTEYFNKIYIIKGFITAILLSTFIYLAHFGIEIKIINTILGLAGIYLLLTIPKKALFYAGFFTGIFWCYWMAVSLQYYGIAYVAPLLILGIGLVFGIIFFLFAIIDKITFRIFMVFAFLFVSPFGFNWLKLELLFVDSYISTTKIAFALVLLSMYFVIKLKRAKVLAILPLLFTLNFGSGEFIDTTKAKIYMPQMYIQQDLKWQKESLDDLIKYNLHQIFEAIENKYDLVILPETAFPIALNRYPQIDIMLKELSNEIDIITGALYVENNKIFNASYHYSKEKVQIAQKVVLVPFGEKIPLPKFFVDLINKVFYNGAQDYSEADNPTDFEVLGEKYRNAICYEGTTDKIYENLDDTRYMIMISNNAWFTPSIEPTLQHLLLKYYSKKYGITIFHTANGSKNRIYRP
ncbi:apolipoprotein N-acyltransferase [Arcobacter sp. CECT 9188]|uniref:apolipoprotein N-acyltransferase n=1 Tax=Arcobacter sp. CECT 9188 TaxID=2044505 RepID=UPI000DE918C6|nr:apolipoprotein N-acyltransferase [Arcobacter sp. CECT 9188]RBQ27486.1 apolipoprotein N-acyltransferase [Arcobacter sp. CECT 9188]